MPVNSIRLIPAPLDISFSAAKDDFEAFDREFQLLSETDEDPIGQWLKMSKAKGETEESDPVLLNLMVALHRKVDELTRLIKEEEIAQVPMKFHAQIESIGFEYFKLKDELLKPNERYYGRISMPIFPKRDVPVWFEAIDTKTAKIEQLHERDEKEWNSYVTARERVMIRQIRGKKNE